MYYNNGAGFTRDSVADVARETCKNGVNLSKDRFFEEAEPSHTKCLCGLMGNKGGKGLGLRGSWRVGRQRGKISG